MGRHGAGFLLLESMALTYERAMYYGAADLVRLHSACQQYRCPRTAAPWCPLTECLLI